MAQTKFTGKLLGIGNPLLDISAHVGPDLLEKYNVKAGTAILAEEQHMDVYETLVCDYEVMYIAGGATQNTCRVAQWMLKAAATTTDTTCQVAYMGCVGTDAYGTTLEDCAKKDGVFVHYMKHPSVPTGTCAALIVDRERALIANLAAANEFQASHLDNDISKEIINSMQIYYSAGFFLTVAPDAFQKVAQHCVANKKTVAVNLSAPFIVEFFKDPLAMAIEYADYVFGNETEAETYARVHGYDATTDLKALALIVSALPKKSKEQPRTVIFTQGHKSTIVACNGIVTEYPIDNVLAKEVITDTNGAGDAFCGGFLAQLVLGSTNVKDAVMAGHWAARYIIQVPGTTLNGPCEYYKK